ncbi:hypothetical protein GTP45_22215 [Pseudoduganella sp. FT55W]|uniref:Uncharacterized protein n=1 Tax=Duganella rivi TaxID=2666083 RepID=A0A7X4GTT2_9BURK|nr:hypothetical protein [Duganella rivi]MYM69536.1 hypothetical protein [Duganella rivi]
MDATISFDQPVRLRRAGIAAGIAVSLLLHAVLIFGYRLPTETPQQPARAMTVWLQPPKPPQVVARAAPPPEKPRKREPVPNRAPQRVIAAEATPGIIPPAPAATPAESQAVTLPPDPLYPDQQPKQFDMNEALKTARKVAKEKAPPGTLAAQLEAHPINTEPVANELATKMAAAKKTDCLKSASGAGLLAPLFWALDKHCKF